MDDELSKLNKRIKLMLEKKDIPEHVKKELLDIYDECRRLSQEYINEYFKLDTNRNTRENIKKYIDKNQNEAISKISAKYKEKYKEKAEVINIVLSTLESQSDKQIEKSERDILEKCVRNSKENDLIANNIISIVMDSIGSMKKQLFKALELLESDKEKIEYITTQVKVIENNARKKITSIKADFNIQDQEILEQILLEYQKYKETKIKQDREVNKNSHKTFINEYKVLQDNLKIKPKTQETASNLTKKDENINDDIR